MFKLELTDGHKTISAMEYVTIPSLTKKIPPGTKLQLLGPIQVVNHILLLGPQNIKILGGDVDHLLVINAYENVLLRALGKPTTDTPITEYRDENPIMETQRNNGNIVAKPMTSSTSNNNQAPVAELLDGINFTEEDDVDMEMLMQIEQDERNFQANKENQNLVNPQVEFENDDIIAQMDIDSIEQSANYRQDDVPMEVIEIRDEIPRRIPKATDLLIPPIIIPEDDEDLEVNLNDIISRPTTFQNSDDPVPRKVARVEPTRVPTFTSDDYRFKSSDSCNFVTIDQYLTMRATDKMRREYVVWGKVSNVPINTLRIKNQEWQLHGDLRDSYSNQPLPVKFHNKILEKLSGSTGAEMTAMYKQVKTRPQVKDDIHKARNFMLFIQMSFVI
jgi:RecQ mediated genome instability protein